MTGSPITKFLVPSLKITASVVTALSSLNSFFWSSVRVPSARTTCIAAMLSTMSLPALPTGNSRLVVVVSYSGAGGAPASGGVLATAVPPSPAGAGAPASVAAGGGVGGLGLRCFSTRVSTPHQKAASPVPRRSMRTVRLSFSSSTATSSPGLRSQSETSPVVGFTDFSRVQVW